MLRFQTGASKKGDVNDVVAELSEQLDQDNAALALVFASSDYDCEHLVDKLTTQLSPTPVYGCTTAGEIGPSGFIDGGVVATTIGGAGVRVGSGVAVLEKGALSAGRNAATMALDALSLTTDQLVKRHHVALTLIDGRSRKEESFVAGVASVLSAIDIVGGSASDRQEKRLARVFEGGKAHVDVGLVLLLSLETPFTVFMTEHTTSVQRRVVVTKSDPATRTVDRLDGRPALDVFEELVGSPIDRETAGRFPFAEQIGGRCYVRSVMDVRDRALEFACAVENGVILSLVEPGNLLACTDVALASMAQRLDQDVAGVLAFHCLGRFLEARANGSVDELGAILTRVPCIGFNTFGEQIGALHVNHTLTGLAFARGRE